MIGPLITTIVDELDKLPTSHQVLSNLKIVNENAVTGQFVVERKLVICRSRLGRSLPQRGAKCPCTRVSRRTERLTYLGKVGLQDKTCLISVNISS